MRKPSTIKIGKQLQEIRKSNGYTQEKMAEGIGVTVRYISDIEQDRAKPSYEVLIKICNIFGISLDQIFSQYLSITGNKMLQYPLVGYDKLSEENKKTIDHLITYFNKMWSKCISSPELLAVKHMCRKFVFRIILNYIQQTHYFDALMVENQRATAKAEKKIESDFNSKTSYARKIANTLYRKDIEERIGGTREYVTFPEIIRSVLKPPYLSKVPTDQHIEDLAAIMYLMNETRNEMTNWAPLIMIKFDNEQVYNKETLTKELKKQWRLYKEKGGKEKYKNYFNKYGVHITASGAFFAKMVPDFEYFACRFADKYPALMVRENFKKVGKDSYQCIELINVVKENAFWCVDEVIDRDKKFFGSTGRGPKLEQRFKPLYDPNSPYKWIYVSDPKNGTAIPHPMRILYHQRGYLLHYVEYLKAVDKEDLSEEARDNITEKVQECIVSYTNKITSIKKENPDYFL